MLTEKDVEAVREKCATWSGDPGTYALCSAVCDLALFWIKEHRVPTLSQEVKP